MKNVLIIYTDQQRYDSLGCNGNKFARTPNLDNLAKDGTVFSRYISANTVCMPSRASFMTGLYPPGHNQWTNGTPLNRREYSGCAENIINPSVSLVQEPETLADIFAAAGYQTASFGKLHLTPSLADVSHNFPESNSVWETGKLDDWHGPYYGFQHVDMTRGHGEEVCRLGHYSVWLRENHPELHELVTKGKREYPITGIGDLFISPVPFELHVTNWLTDRCCEFIGKSGEQPFFYFVGIPDPHSSFAPCYDIVEDFIDMELETVNDPEGNTPVSPLPQANGIISEEHRRLVRQYTHAMNYQIDLAVGKIINCLRENGKYEDTIIIFTSDHGDYLGDHGQLYKSECAHDSLLHVPFILRAPGEKLPAVVNTPMSACDVMPTLAYLTGVHGPEIQHGSNIVDVIRQRKTNRPLAYGGLGKKTNFTIYNEKFRYTYYPQLGYEEIFDHTTDPGECINLIKNPDYLKPGKYLRQELEHRTLRYMNQIAGRVANW